jgi:hypothetical protein
MMGQQGEGTKEQRGEGATGQGSNEPGQGLGQTRRRQGDRTMGQRGEGATGQGDNEPGQA